MARRTSGPKLKRVRDQVIVITGASSGIGLATARLAAKHGARVVLSARNEEDLRAVTDEINANGGRAIAVAADVSKEEDMDRLGEAALRTFGALDTWVNNAGLSIYGKLVDVPMADKRRLFDVNFWGVVNGCRTAVRFLKHRRSTETRRSSNRARAARGSAPPRSPGACRAAAGRRAAA